MEVNQIIQTATGISLAGLGLAFGLQKFMRGWQENSEGGSILELMHKELGRVSEQNSTLSKELGKLHNEVITLNAEITKLVIEKQELQIKVNSLTNEIKRLKTALFAHNSKGIQ